MVCQYDDETGDFDWNKEAQLFACVEPLAFIIGGQSHDLNYLDEVEVLAPGFDCTAQEIEPYPLHLIGASGGYINGKSIGKILLNTSLHHQSSSFSLWGSISGLCSMQNT